MKRFFPLVLALAVVLTACTDHSFIDESDGSDAAMVFEQARGVYKFASIGPDDVALVPGQVIVSFKPGANRAAIAQKNRARHKRDLFLDNSVLLEVPVGEEVATANAISQDPGVLFAEPDYLYTLIPCATGDCREPDDVFFGLRWDLHNTGYSVNQFGQVVQATGLAGADMKWLEAHEYLGQDFAGSAVIAILDSGIRDTHVDLAGRVIAARNFAVGYAPDFIVDRDGHGSHVAGIAASRAAAGTGAPGVAYGQNIRLINAKVCELYLFPDNVVRTSCPVSSTAEAIVWATDQGANVLNLSLGGNPFAASGSAAQAAAFAYARSKNVLPFCATGNDNAPSISFPARFDDCVAVGATNWSDHRASYSNFSGDVVLSAPGGDLNPENTPFSFILAPGHQNDTQFFWRAGTSMAAPQAAGLAGLLFASGMTSASAVLQRMIDTADDLGPAGRDPFFGHGRINVFRAVSGLEPTIAVNASMRDVINLAARGQVQVVLDFQAGQTYDLRDLVLESIVLGSTPVSQRNDGTFMATNRGTGLVLHFDVAALVSNGDVSASTSTLALHGDLSDGRTFTALLPVEVIVPRGVVAAR